MEKMHFSIIIKAPKKKVWETMLTDATYRKWTSVFNPSGSYFEGNWEEGSTMRFLGPEKDGSVSGMISRIKENRLYDYVSIQHIGLIMKGEETIWPAQAGEEALENYTFKDVDGGTEVLVELVLPAEYKDMFNETWPKALEQLKMISEK